MTVYVDDFRTQARVGGISGRWSHLIADTREELHAFASRIGLRRAWFQDPMVNTGLARKGILPKPGSYAAESWHYDVTESKREEAIQAGAVALTWRELPDVIHARMARDRGEVDQ